MALDNKIDTKTRNFLGRAQKASKSLINVIEDLSKLVQVEDEPLYPVDETFNLNLTGKLCMERRRFRLIFPSIKCPKFFAERGAAKSSFFDHSAPRAAPIHGQGEQRSLQTAPHILHQQRF